MFCFGLPGHQYIVEIADHTVHSLEDSSLKNGLIPRLKGNRVYWYSPQCVLIVKYFQEAWLRMICMEKVEFLRIGDTSWWSELWYG